MGYTLYLNFIIHPSPFVVAFPTWNSPRKQKQCNKRQQKSWLLGSALKWEHLVLCHAPVGALLLIHVGRAGGFGCWATPALQG